MQYTNKKIHTGKSVTKRAKLSTVRGFTILEAIVAMFIFSIVMLAVTTFFAKVVVTNRETIRMQKSLEEMQFVMNKVAKVLRTSVVVGPNTSYDKYNSYSIRVFDYSQGKCIEYTFDDVKNKYFSEKIASGSPGADDDEKAWCKGLDSDTDFTEQKLISSSESKFKVSGMFYIVLSKKDVDDKENNQAGMVTMTTTIERGSKESTIQTSTSLRNWDQ